MNERQILEQRIITLDGLLATPGGPLGPKAGPLATQFHQRWQIERRLLHRVLDETPADAPPQAVLETLQLWQDRTAAFVRKSPDERPSWTDREGLVWDAQEVLAVLDDIRERIEAWLAGATLPEAEPEPDLPPRALGA